MRGLENKMSSDRDDCSRPEAATIPGKQSGAQLTILYGGMVNVYEDIPADKAEDILFIAKGGNYSNYSYTRLKILFPVMKSSEGSVIRRHQSSSGKVLTNATGANLFANFLFESYLPITRKHSLQRFLKNRKDRLNAKAKSPYTTSETNNPKPPRYPSSWSSVISPSNSTPT